MAHHRVRHVRAQYEETYTLSHSVDLYHTGFKLLLAAEHSTNFPTDYYAELVVSAGKLGELANRRINHILLTYQEGASLKETLDHLQLLEKHDFVRTCLFLTLVEASIQIRLKTVKSIVLFKMSIQNCLKGANKGQFTFEGK